MITTGVNGDKIRDIRDKIKQYEDMRIVGSSEACWKLFAFPIAENKPPVQKLQIHLENQQHIVFIGGEEDNAVDKGRETELTAFFKFNAKEKERLGSNFKPINMPTYVEMPGKYTFNKPKKVWQVRQRGFSLG